jgi:hypothetical protein
MIKIKYRQSKWYVSTMTLIKQQGKTINDSTNFPNFINRFTL